MSNLLSKPLIQAKDVSTNVAVLYLVTGGKDYQITVDTLLGLISKADLNLDKVDNTSDIEKPISTKVAEALAQKAAVDHKHEIGDINGLSDTLARYITQDTLNNIVSNLENLISDSVTKDTFNAYAQGIANTLQQIAVADASMAGRIKALEDAGVGDYVTNSALSTLINNLTGELNLQFAAIDQVLASKADKNHTHTSNDISDFGDAVINIVKQSGLISFIDGPNEW